MRFWALFALIYSASAFSIQNDGKSLQDWWVERQPWLVKHQVIQANQTPQHVNRLIKQDSAYLLSHALQPVDWFSWEDEALFTATNKNKLIYVSVGYQTCHWCHVLAQESYENAEVAELLNLDFVSIKVDRETHPEIDQKYRRALENMTGNPGWPIQAILTPERHILWIDSYTPRSQLTNTLKRLSAKWKSNPQALRNIANMQEKQLLPEASAAQKKVSRQILSETYLDRLAKARELLIHEQQNNGPRFLRANWLLLLLDEYLLNQKESDLEIVTTQIEQLLTSPTYDFIDGGMHRYAEDGSWQRPHYEKMLYDQALLIRVLSRLAQITKNKQYILFAEQTISFVDEHLSSEIAYASSISAFSDGVEGNYYLYEENMGVESAQWGQSVLANDYLMFLQAVDLPSKTDLQPLAERRREKARPLQDEKSILAWNSLYLLSLTELYQVTKSPLVKQRATRLAKHIVEYFYTDSGLYRIVFSQKTSVEARVEDYAYTIIALYEAYWTFQDAEYLAFIEHISPAFVNRINMTNWKNLMADLQLDSAAAATLNALHLLSSYANPSRFREELNALKVHNDPLTLTVNSIGFLGAWNKNLHAPFASLTPFAMGKGLVQVVNEGEGLYLRITLAQGWHINSSQPLDNALYATQLSSPLDNAVVSAEFPEPTIKPLGFSGQPLSLYEGTVHIPFTIDSSPSMLPLLQLQVQACSNKVCLLPENINLIF